MSGEGTTELAEAAAWEAGGLDGSRPGETLHIDVSGYEGPLDLLLALARTQKVDLAKISVLDLVDQYLAFIAEAHTLRLELAADYLLMAAWLAYLKSRLLLPREEKPGDTASAEELAQRSHSGSCGSKPCATPPPPRRARKRLGVDVFPRGTPEGVRTIRERQYTAAIYDLLRAYADQRRRTIKVGHVVKARKVWSIKDARGRLERLVDGSVGDWVQLDLFLAHYVPIGEEGRTARPRARSAPARDGARWPRRAAPGGPLRPHIHAQARGRELGTRRWRRRPWPRATKTRDERMVPPRLSRCRSARSSTTTSRAGAEEPARGPPGCSLRLCPRCRCPSIASGCGSSRRCCSPPPSRWTRKRLAGALKEGGDVGALLIELQAWYAERGINLVRVAGKWTFHGRGPVLRSGASCDRGVPPLEGRARDAGDHRLSPAGHARRDRGDPRRVDLCRHARHPARDALVRPRDAGAPGRPLTYGTTEEFLGHFGLDSIKDLPGLAELKGAGLLDGNLPPGFAVPEPSDVAQRSCRTSCAENGEEQAKFALALAEDEGPLHRSRSPADGGREK